MKKRFLALACAMTMVLGLGISANAAGSSSSGSVAASSVAQPSVEVLVTAESNSTGQVLTSDTINEFATTTTVEGGSVSAVSTATAKNMIAEANKIAGDKTFIATIVDINAPAGATVTVGCPNVWKGQNVTILHQKSDGTYETITPNSVEDNKVTFTSASYSPFAIVINTGSAARSPKTGEIIALVAAMAAISGIGAAACSRKAKKN